MTATARDQIKERLGITDETSAVNSVDELRSRLRAISPEALAGDPAAVAEADQLSQEIATEVRRVELEALAAAEHANRERIAAEQEAERKRDEAGRAKAEVEAERERELVKLDKLLKQLGSSIATVHELDIKVQVLGPQHQPGTHGWDYKPRLHRVVDVLAWELTQFKINDLPHVSGGRPSLVMATATQSVPTDCAVCKRDDVEAINAALAARSETGDGLRTLQERFGVSKSTLSRHAGHV